MRNQVHEAVMKRSTFESIKFHMSKIEWPTWEFRLGATSSQTSNFSDLMHKLLELIFPYKN